MKISVKEKILFIHQQSHVGGGQTYVSNLVEEMDRLGYVVVLLQDKPFWEIVKAIVDPSFRTIIWNDYTRLPLVLYFISFFLKKKNITIIYGIWLYEYRSLVHRHRTLQRTIKHLIHQGIVWAKQFMVCGMSNQITHLSEYSKRLFFSTPFFWLFKNKKNVIIYGGVALQNFHSVSESKKLLLRRQIGIRKEDMVLLMVGRIEPRKNYVDGIRILRRMRSLSPEKNTTLCILFSHGACNDISYLEDIATEIQLQGMGPYVKMSFGLTNEETAKYYQMADAYLMLSNELETFGLVTLESLASGCPVFGYKSCATPEIITYHSNKFLFSPGHITDVAQAITKHTNMPSRNKNEIKIRLRGSVLGFSWTQVVKRLVS